MTAQQAQAFNDALVEKGTTLTVRAYLKRLNNEVFKQPIEDFVDDLLDLVIRDDFCIPHEKLVKYGVLTSTKCGDVTRLLIQYDFKEGLDFSASTRQSTGGRPAKAYHLRPETFEHCLMRARNTDKYTKFYSLLRKCVTLYDKYQLAMERRENGHLTKQNTNLTEKNTDLEQMLAEMRAELRAASKKTDNKLDTMNDKLDGLHDANTVLLASVNGIKDQFSSVAAEAHLAFAMQEVVADRHVAAAADKAIPPEDPTKTDSILLLALDAYQYAALRVQVKTAGSAVRKQREKYPNLREVLHLTDLPNSKYLWTRCREVLGRRILMAPGSCTTFALQRGATEATLVAVLRELCDEPVEQAAVASAATKTLVDISRQKVSEAETAASRVMTVVTTTTTTKTITLKPDEVESMLAEAMGLTMTAADVEAMLADLLG
jgi:hypothetical protein